MMSKDLETVSEIFHEAWLDWASSVESEVSKERRKCWSKYWKPYDQLDEEAKDRDREYALRVIHALENKCSPT